MSSTTMNRPSGAGSNTARSTRFGDYTTPVGRPNEEEKTMQGSSLVTIRSNGWQNSSGIWGNSTYGSGLTNSKRDSSRSRVQDDDEYQGASGSGALAASSEALWSRTWPVDKTSPTISTSGSASPERHRGSGPLLLSQTSPYLTTSRTSIGQGSALSNSRSPGKSSLDPALAPFTYPIQKTPYGFIDDKENLNQMNAIQNMDSYGFERTWRSNSSASRDNSGPPSRHSESGSSGAANGSFLGNGQYIGHTPNNSLQMQRPFTQGRAASFASPLNGRGYNDLNEQLAEMSLGFNRSKESYLHSSVEHPYAQPSDYPGHSLPPSQPGSVSTWPTGLSSASRVLNGYRSDNSMDSALSDQLNGSKLLGFSEREPRSPGINNRNQQNRSDYYSASEKAAAESEQAALRHLRLQQNGTELHRELHRHQFTPPQQYFPQPQVVYNGGQFQGQYPPHAYDYSPQHNFHINHQQQHGYQMPQPPYTSALPPRGPARDQDFGGFILRSQLLEEFRVSSKTNRRYELKDIYKHVVEFSGDQHGSRFIQQKLETANSDEKDQIFREIQPNALQLMTDVFGNYVIQKFFEHGNQVQKRILAENMKNHVNDLSVQMYGCRVVQKALEHVLADQQAELVKELQHDILKCVKDQHGNHVIQKAIERVPTEHIQFIIEAFKGQVHTLATHPYGCRVIQRMLEHCTDKDQAAVLAELHACAHTLITDQYGNYVMQHVIEHGKLGDKAKIIDIVTAQLLHLSKHKFASNVVEKTIQFGSDHQRRAILAELTATPIDGSSPLQLMMKDQYGNYVIQKLLVQLKGTERERFVDEMRPHLNVLKKYNYGKQITAIEKLISNGLPTQTSPIEINSTTATPILTMEQNSPESSSLPSTNASTVDGPTQPHSTKTVVPEKAMPKLELIQQD